MAGTSIISKVNSTLNIRETDASGLALSATCTGAPPTTANVFAHGCQIVRTDSGTGNKAIYENVGSSAVPSWNLLGDVTAGEITLPNTQILVGNASGVAAAVAMSGDATIANTGAVTIANDAITEAKVADTAGTGALGIKKIALAVYDFAVDGGAQGAISLTGSPTIPDNAVVTAFSYDVLQTFTSATDAATVKLNLVTDGDLTTAIAISDAGNYWDAGIHSVVNSTVNSPIPQKTTGARTLQITVAGGENLTAGKAVFQVEYWVSVSQ